jgi:hypothetical protein
VRENRAFDVVRLDARRVILNVRSAGGTIKGTMGTTNVCAGQAALISRHSNDVHLLVLRTYLRTV